MLFRKALGMISNSLSNDMHQKQPNDRKHHIATKATNNHRERITTLRIYQY